MIENVPDSISIELARPVCPKCGAAWRWVDRVIDCVFCASKSHGMLWYYPSVGSVRWEVTVATKRYSVRWLCSCMRPECKGRNVIIEDVDYDNHADPVDGGVWYFDAPLTISLDDVAAIVARVPDEHE